MVEIAQPELGRHCVKRVLFLVGDCRATELKTVYGGISVIYLIPFASYAYKRGIEIRIMSDKRSIAAKFEKFSHRFPLGRGVLYHSVGNSGKLGYIFGDRAFGVYKGAKLLRYFHIYKLYRPDFGNTVGFS